MAFYTPPGYSGTAILSASSGLRIDDQGLWKFSQAGYNDGRTFGLSLGHPKPLNGGNLNLSATNWNIAVVGNELTAYDDGQGTVYPANRCRITVRGQWKVIRQQNSNSFNSFGIQYNGHTHTDLGNRDYWGTFITGYATYVIQGSAVTGGALDTFSSHEFYCRMTETASSENSNREFQSNTISQPIWVYSYSKSWEI